MRTLFLKPIILFIFLVSMVACKQALFTGAERDLIHNGGEEAPFDVLTILNDEDVEKLRNVSEDIPLQFDDTTLQLLLKKLSITLKAANGVGIAAPQVGINKNIFLFIRLDLPDEPVITVINPKIVRHPIETVCFEGDGCLSIPGFSGNSVRYPWVEVEYYTENGEPVRERLEGYSRQDTFSAVIFQHEYDHLQGVLFTDKRCDAPDSDGEKDDFDNHFDSDCEDDDF
ncbi:MAG: peptide deformylase [Prevotellaceae bacterium]|jgi:peptide deformylase|nr:peptide deformylase [Prevotellaceae bacterium]